MSPSNYAKSLGAKSLREVSEAADINLDTLRRWHDTRPAAFRYLVMGVVQDRTYKRVIELLGG